MKQTAVQWYAIESGKLEVERAKGYLTFSQMFDKMLEILKQAKSMEKEQMLDFGDFIIDELAPMAQNREWVEERYNYFKSE